VYQNKRCEMYDTFRQWFEEGGVSIPDDDEFVNDILSIPVLEPTTSRGLLGLPSKKEMAKQSGIKSTDIADAAVLTFSFPVFSDSARNRVHRKSPEMIRKSSPLATVRRFAGNTKETGGFTQKVSFI
jgi:hypothetical protein